MRFTLSAALALLATSLWSDPGAAQCVSLTTVGSASTQSFDTLSNTAGSTTNNLTITGWFMTESGGGARDNEQYAVDTGASTTGDTYSYGAAGNTDRALGGLQSGTLIPVIGACYTNNTGTSLTGLAIAYSGEQWRLGATARVDRMDFQYSLNATDLVTGTWTDVDALDFVGPVTAGTTGALDGNAAANRSAISSTISSLSIANGATFWIRWNDLNATGADDGLAVDSFSLTPQGSVGPTPSLTINDVTVTEGNAGTVTASFTVSLSIPAGAGGVSFDIATANNSATTADNDYVGQTLTGQTIAAGGSSYTFNVTVNGDTTVEPNETFFVNVSNITGATAGDAQGLGTITNDDVALTPIHDIQGPGNSSPIVGTSVTTRGIVTGVKTNGFFIQEPDATIDADPATSEGVFVFTSAAPPASAAVGNLLQVTGTVIEFVPASDPLQPPLTEISAPTVTLVSSGNPLPAPVALTPSFPSPAGPYDQLERVEGMRVTAASLTASSGTGGTVTESSATASNNGVFYAYVTGVARGFREPGIQPPDPAPAGTIPPIPRWDGNPEVLRVDSDGLVGTTALLIGAGQTVANVTGPLDYGFRRYQLLPESNLTAAGTRPTVVVSPPLANELTIASYNLQRFFDDVNDPAIGEPVLTSVAYGNRLAKASLGIRNALQTPDIVGVIEVENLSTLQALATRINSDAVAASQPDPQYVAYLVEGNDVGGIDVGFLVKTATVVGTTPRVTVNAVVQELDASLFTNPDTSTETLHDRPPLRLDAVVNTAAGQTYPVTVIVNHLRSLNGSDDTTAGSNGWTTVGQRVRAKRQAQAVDLANLVQTRQINNPTESIVLVGDFNAFEFNDGLADTMNTIAGTPTPDNQTAVAGDGADLVTPDLDNLFDSPVAAERYSYVFDGNAQSLDHALVSASVIGNTAARRLEHARINADFAEADRNNAATPNRLSDHDPLVVYLRPNAFLVVNADLSVTLTDSPDPVTAGTNLSYTALVTNGGSGSATDVTATLTLPASTTFVSANPGAGGSCSGTGPVVCTWAGATANGATRTVTVTVSVPAAAANSSLLSAQVVVSSLSNDPVPGNNTATAGSAVITRADMAITLTDTPDPVVAGAVLSYTASATNGGASDAQDVAITVNLPAEGTLQSASASLGGSCSGTGPVVCSWAGATAPTAQRTATVAVTIAAGTPAGTQVFADAQVGTATGDPVSGNNSASTGTLVTAQADVSITLVDSPDPVVAGTQLSYLATLSNNGISAAPDAAITLPLPAGTTLVSATPSAGGNCTTGASVVCTWLGATAVGGTRTATVVVTVSSAQTAALSATATASSAATDPNNANNNATATTAVNVSADLSITLTDAPDPVAGGTQLTYTAVVSNAGPSDASGVTITLPLPVNTTLVSGSVSGGGSCAGSPVVCSVTGSIAAGGSRTATIVLAVDPSAPDGTLTATATVAAASPDPNLGNNSATTTTTVVTQADLLLTLTSTATQVELNVPVTFTATSLNQGPSAAQDVSITLTLTPDFRYASHTASAGAVCTTPQVGNTGAIVCTWAGATAAGATRTLAVSAYSNTEGNSAVNASTSSPTPDPVANNNASAVSVQVGLGVREIPTLDARGLLLLSLLLGLIGATLLRKR